MDPGSAGLLGRRGPRSKQPFMVTFFRASPSPARVTRAAKPPRRRQHKKSNDLPHPNKLPGIFGKIFFYLFFFLEEGALWKTRSSLKSQAKNSSEVLGLEVFLQRGFGLEALKEMVF